jgi:hypothetical protein
MNHMGEMILIRSPWKAYIDLRHIELEFIRNEEIDPEIHPIVGCKKNRSSDLFPFHDSSLQNRGSFPSWKGARSTP